MTTVTEPDRGTEPGVDDEIRESELAEVEPGGPDEYETVTGFDLPYRTKMLIMAGAMLAMFLSSMEQTVVSTALPRIVSDLDGLKLIAWVVTAFLLTSVTVIPVAGRLSDIYGRKPLLLIGLVVFLSGSALSGFSQDMTQLVLFRGLQGFGAGVLMANTMAISGDLFPPSERGKYMGMFAGIFGISAIIGPTLGGFLTDTLSWRWVFWINLPVGVFSVVAIFFFMPWIRPAKRKVKIDYLGVATLVWALVPGLLALALIGDSASITDAHILLMFLASAVGVVVFILTERRAAEPIVPLELFKNRTFRTAAIVMTGMGVGVFGVSFFIPLFVQGVIGKTATQSGTILTPQMLAVVVMAALSGQIMSRTGKYKIIALIGSVLLFSSMLSMTQLNINSSLGDVIWRMVLFGLGMGLIFPVMMLAVQNAVPQRLLGTVSSSSQFFQTIGGLVGITIFGTLLNNRVAADIAKTLPDDLAKLASPQQLVDPRQREAIIDAIGIDQFLLVADATRQALSNAIVGNFWISVGVVILIFFALLQLKELKLRDATNLGGAEDQDANPAVRPPDTGPSEAAPPETAPTAQSPPAVDAAPSARPPPLETGTPRPAPVLASSTLPPIPDGKRASLWAQAAELRLPAWSVAKRRRVELIGALTVGSAMGLAASVSARNGNGRRATKKRQEVPSGSPGARIDARLDQRIQDVRRRTADWLDPPRPLQPPKRRWFKRGRPWR